MRLPRLDGLNVLVVDDRRDARFVVQHILRDAGASVTALENGQQAVETLTSSAPDDANGFQLIVLDVAMPVLDGLSATRQLRSMGYYVPILALTAGTMDQDRRDCLAAGCDDYLKKPIDALRLVETASRLVRS